MNRGRPYSSTYVALIKSRPALLSIIAIVAIPLIVTGTIIFPGPRAFRKTGGVLRLCECLTSIGRRRFPTRLRE